jgi:hypothetical protein
MEDKPRRWKSTCCDDVFIRLTSEENGSIAQILLVASLVVIHTICVMFTLDQYMTITHVRRRILAVEFKSAEFLVEISECIYQMSSVYTMKPMIALDTSLLTCEVFILYMM